MKQELQEQYRAIRANIQNNVDTIGRLIKQAQSLRTLVDSLGGTQENKEIKETSSPRGSGSLTWGGPASKENKDRT